MILKSLMWLDLRQGNQSTRSEGRESGCRRVFRTCCVSIRVRSVLVVFWRWKSGVVVQVKEKGRKAEIHDAGLFENAI
jgi:hypothetical protein